MRPETELMFRVNVIAVIEMIQLVSRLMARNGGGSIVNIASVTAVLGSAGQSAYSATKGAIMSFTKSAAKELAPMGIRVNAVAPGIVKTERFAELYEESGIKNATLIPLCDYIGYHSNRQANGKVYLAIVNQLSDLPESEMESVSLFDKLPNELTYPIVTPCFFNEAKIALKRLQIK